jgi:hypothetical protein
MNSSRNNYEIDEIRRSAGVKIFIIEADKMVRIIRSLVIDIPIRA